jgi:signal transduction histidine kinase
MRAIAFLRRRRRELAWVVFATANLVAMLLWPSWETIPFHFIWVSLTLLYGLTVWRLAPTAVILGTVALATGALIMADAFDGTQLWGELFEVPLMSAMFLAMVWHAQRRQQALASVERLADERARLLERQERFVHDASHELRTPITITRGHLEVLQSANGHASAEIDVALDELGRMERIVERLLLLAKAEQVDFVVESDLELEPFLEDVFMRWCEIAPRAWRLEADGFRTVRGDPEALRIALDALLENAVKHTETGAAIVIRSRRDAGGVAIDVSDAGPGIPSDALARIFERFARADASRSRADGGAGLGLAIVDAIAKAHQGSCEVASAPTGSTFSLRLPPLRCSSEPAVASPALLEPS